MYNTQAILTEPFMEDFSQHQVPYSRMRVKNLLNAVEGDNVIESITTESQVEFNVSNSDSIEGDTKDFDDNKVKTAAKNLKLLAVATVVLKRQERITKKAQSIMKASQ